MLSTLSRGMMVALLISTALAAAAPAAFDVGEAARHVVESLVREDWHGVTGQFTAEMKQAASDEKLAHDWNWVWEQWGDFQRVIEVDVQENHATVHCQLRRGRMETEVFFAADHRVSGLRFHGYQPPRSAFTVPPYVAGKSFRSEAFAVHSGALELPGRLTRPTNTDAARLPAIVLVQGSGATDHDETVDAYKPFRDLALGLSVRGIAVLRYDKRTYVYPNLPPKSVTPSTETIDDALAAVAALRQTAGIDPKRIFVLGHSLGGRLAPTIASRDPAIAGVICLAGSLEPMEDALVRQNRYLLSLDGPMSPRQQAQLETVIRPADRIRHLTSADAESPELLLGAAPAYWLELRSIDPVKIANSIGQPMLILQGERDYQVTVADFKAWQAGLANRPQTTFKLYPKLNHFFVAGEGPSYAGEYDTPGYVDEAVVTDIAAWVLGN